MLHVPGREAKQCGHAEGHSTTPCGPFSSRSTSTFSDPQGTQKGQASCTIWLRTSDKCSSRSPADNETNPKKNSQQQFMTRPRHLSEQHRGETGSAALAEHLGQNAPWTTYNKVGTHTYTHTHTRTHSYTQGHTQPHSHTQLHTAARSCVQPHAAALGPLQPCAPEQVRQGSGLRIDRGLSFRAKAPSTVPWLRHPSLCIQCLQHSHTQPRRESVQPTSSVFPCAPNELEILGPCAVKTIQVQLQNPKPAENERAGDGKCLGHSR